MREFKRNETAADENDLCRKVVELQEFAAGHHQLMTVDRQPHRDGTGGQHEVARLETVLADGDRLRVQKSGAPFDEVNPAVLQAPDRILRDVAVVESRRLRRDDGFDMTAGCFVFFGPGRCAFAQPAGSKPSSSE